MQSFNFFSLCMIFFEKTYLKVFSIFESFDRKMEKSCLQLENSNWRKVSFSLIKVTFSKIISLEFVERKFTLNVGRLLKTDFIHFTKNSLNKQMYSISYLLDQREVYRTQSMSGSKPNLGKSCESQQGKWENSTTLTFFCTREGLKC